MKSLSKNVTEVSVPLLTASNYLFSFFALLDFCMIVPMRYHINAEFFVILGSIFVWNRAKKLSKYLNKLLLEKINSTNTIINSLIIFLPVVLIFIYTALYINLFQ